MRWHVYTEALHPDGDIAAGHVLTFYADSAATTQATLYADAFGETTRENPYTVPLSGMVDFWTYDQNLWFVPQGSTTAYLVEINVGSPLDRLNVRDYGATGDGVTDDTHAIQQAIDAAVALGRTTAIYSSYNRPTVYLPSGDYVVTGFHILDRGMSFRGDGKNSTNIILSGAGSIFELATFDATPANPYIGSVEAQDFYLEGMTLSKPGFTNSAIDSQTGTAIRDNGAGWVTMRSINIWGFEYGYYAPYGSDFQWWYDCLVQNCLTGIYYGPGCQQVQHFGTVMGLCGTMVKIEGASQGNFFGCSFNESKYRDFDFRCPAALESGVTGIAPEAELNWAFYGSWFETGAGWATGWNPEEHIRVGATGDSYPVRGITFRDTYLVSGSIGMGSKATWRTANSDPTHVFSFVNAEFGANVTIDGIHIAGDYIDAVVTHPTGASYPAITVRNLNMTDGYTAIPVFDPWTVGQRYITDETGVEQEYSEGMGQAPQILLGAAGDFGAALQTDGYNIDFAGKQSGTWYTRMRFNVGNSRLHLGNTLENSVQWASAAPTSGTYAAGNIIFNTGAAPSGTVGWVCTTAGTAGAGAVFKTFGAITA